MVRSTIGASVPMASAMREPGLVRCPSRWPSCALTWNETVTSSSLKLPVRVVQRHPLDLYLGLDADIEAEEDGVDVIIGEVKEGRAELNAGLRRTDTVAFAIRRLGCCPERDVSDAADRDGETHLTMAPGLPAGSGSLPSVVPSRLPMAAACASSASCTAFNSSSGGGRLPGISWVVSTSRIRC